MDQQFETVVIGGGQAGLAAAYHLSRRGRGYVVVDAGDRVGDMWRHRWDSRLSGRVAGAGQDARYVVDKLNARIPTSLSLATSMRFRAGGLL